MRIVYDDKMQADFVECVDDVMLYLRRRVNLAPCLQYEYGMQRVQRGAVKAFFARLLIERGYTIGETVTHASGIGNNCKYPVYFRADSELQNCAYISFNVGLYGELYVYVTDYNNMRISHSYKVTQYGVTETR